MKYKLLISDEIEYDLEAIYRYLYLRFGIQAMDNFEREYRKTIQQITDHPNSFSTISESAKKEFKKAVIKKSIFYFKLENQPQGVITILRIIDGRQNQTKLTLEEPKVTYASAGVNKEEGYRSVELMKKKVAKTLNENVLSGLGSFGAFYALKDYKNPVLVSGTDGVGTKLKVAFDTQTYNTVGIDCVAMCVNDVLCHGAQPLFFLDYLACGKLDAEVAAELVGGIADGCELAGAALVGGETAEMPGFYKPGDYDIAGFTVGAVERDQIINGSAVQEGDAIIALPASGVHSNGFSLVRKVITDYNAEFQGKPMHQTLLEPTKIYVKPVLDVISQHEVHGLAHITGGGLIENVPRALNDNTKAVIQKDQIKVLPIFKHIMEQGVPESEMWGTFNMGVGFVIIAPEAEAAGIIKTLANHQESAYKIGHISTGEKGIELV